MYIQLHFLATARHNKQIRTCIPNIACQLGMKHTCTVSKACVPVVMLNQCNFLLFAGGAGTSLTSLSCFLFA